MLLVLPLALLGVATLKAVFGYGVGYLMAYVGNRVVADIRQELFQRIMRLSVGYHDTNTSGRLVSRVVNDVGMMANAGIERRQRQFFRTDSPFWRWSASSCIRIGGWPRSLWL